MAGGTHPPECFREKVNREAKSLPRSVSPMGPYFGKTMYGSYNTKYVLIPLNFAINYTMMFVNLNLIFVLKIVFVLKKFCVKLPSELHILSLTISITNNNLTIIFAQKKY